MTAEAALEAVRPVVNYDSEMSYKNLAPQKLGIPEILYAQKITESPSEAVLTLRLRDGRATTVRLTAVYWRDSDVDENRPWVAPDLSTPLSSADFLENRDPALTRILAYQAPATLLDQLKEKFEWGGMNAAANHYYRYRNSPDTAAVDTEKTMLGLAEYLIGRSKAAEAVQIFQRATVEFPKSFDAFFGLGRLMVAQRDKAKAIDALKKALAIRPADPAAKEWLAKAEALK